MWLGWVETTETSEERRNAMMQQAQQARPVKPRPGVAVPRRTVPLVGQLELLRGRGQAAEAAILLTES